MRFNIIKIVKPEIRENDGKRFYFIKFGSERHGKPSFIVWIHKFFVNENEKVIFPLFGELIKTEKNNLVIRPTDNDNKISYFIFPIYATCEYRGSSSIELLAPNNAVMLKFYIYHSPLGNLGISEGGLILTENFPVKLRATYTGRLYGDDNEEFILIKNHNLDIETFSDNIDSIKDLL